MPWTWLSMATAAPSRPSSSHTRARLARTSASASPRSAPRLSEANGPALTPPRRVVKTAPAGASVAITISSGPLIRASRATRSASASCSSRPPTRPSSIGGAHLGERAPDRRPGGDALPHQVGAGHRDLVVAVAGPPPRDRLGPAASAATAVAGSAAASRRSISDGVPARASAGGQVPGARRCRAPSPAPSRGRRRPPSASGATAAPSRSAHGGRSGAPARPSGPRRCGRRRPPRPAGPRARPGPRAAARPRRPSRARPAGGASPPSPATMPGPAPAPPAARPLGLGREGEAEPAGVARGAHEPARILDEGVRRAAPARGRRRGRPRRRAGSTSVAGAIPAQRPTAMALMVKSRRARSSASVPSPTVGSAPGAA